MYILLLNFKKFCSKFAQNKTFENHKWDKWADTL